VLVEDVRVDGDDAPDAETGELLDHIAAQAAASDDGSRAVQKVYLLFDRYGGAVAAVTLGNDSGIERRALGRGRIEARRGGDCTQIGRAYVSLTGGF
jgi:hypothetical protein